MFPALVPWSTSLAQFPQSEAKGTLVLQDLYSTFCPPPWRGPDVRIEIIYNWGWTKNPIGIMLYKSATQQRPNRIAIVGYKTIMPPISKTHF
jgi:hypothetical protein